MNFHQYFVASFHDDGDGISVVPTSWQIDETLIFWPKNSKNLRTQIIRCLSPKEDWPTYRVKKIYGYFNNYDEALEEEKEAARTSESENNELRGPGKRKSKQNKPYSPPPSFCSSMMEAADVHQLNPVPDCQFEPETNASKASGCSEALSPQSITTQTISSASNNSNIDQKSDDDTADQTLIGNVIDGIQDLIVLPVPDVLEVTNFDIFQKLEGIEKTLSFIMHRLNILETSKGVEPKTPSFTKLPVFPISTIELLLTFEDNLAQDKEVQEQMYNKFMQLGGKHEADFIRRSLTHVFTNRLACSCSWTGQKSNFRIKDLKLMDILKAAVTHLFKSSDKTLEVAVMEWFRHSNQRLKRELV